VITSALSPTWSYPSTDQGAGPTTHRAAQQRGDDWNKNVGEEDAVMSKRESPRGLSAADFHRRPGVSAWRVTPWGPQAVFVASSLAAGARLVPAIVAAAERCDVAPDVDLRAEAVIVRVPYRGADRIPANAADFAAEVAAMATARA